MSEIVTAEEMARRHADEEACFQSGPAAYWSQRPVSEPCLVPNPFADLIRQRDEALVRAEAAESALTTLRGEYDEMVMTDLRQLRIDRDAWSAKCAEQATEMDRLRTEMAEEVAGYEEMLSAKNAWADRALLCRVCGRIRAATRRTMNDPRRIGGPF